LNNPFRRWVPSDVEVQDFPVPVLNDEEAVEQAEGDGWYRKKIERNDRLAMVQEKAQPLFAWVSTAVCGPKIPGDGSFRNNEPTSWSSPWILAGPNMGSLPSFAG
jgi:hypothetical protein